MGEDEGATITICTAPPGLYAVVKHADLAFDSDKLRTITVVTAFKYTYFGDGKEIFSEPLVYCEDKKTNALVDGKSQIEFVGSFENCALKIKEMFSLHYTEKNAEKNKR